MRLPLLLRCHTVQAICFVRLAPRVVELLVSAPLELCRLVLLRRSARQQFRYRLHLLYNSLFHNADLVGLLLGLLSDGPCFVLKLHDVLSRLVRIGDLFVRLF